jgi:hypothetical protein
MVIVATSAMKAGVAMPMPMVLILIMQEKKKKKKKRTHLQLVGDASGWGTHVRA